jgi:hypothetical protein
MNYKTKSAAIMLCLLSTSTVHADNSVEFYETLINQHTVGSFSPVHKDDSQYSCFDRWRNQVGNGLRSLGEKLRQPDNLDTDVGYLSHATKEVTCEYAKQKTGISFSTKVFNSIGNGLRWLGSKLRVVEETQTLNRALLNAANIHHTTNSATVTTKLGAISAAFVKNGPQADAQYLDFVEALKLRGHQVDQIAHVKFTEELAKETLKDEKLVNDEKAAKKTLTQRLTAFLEKTGLATTWKTITEYVSSLYEKVRNWLK